MPVKTVTVPLTVTMRTEAYEKLTSTIRDISRSEVLSNLCRQFLEQRADGGLLLKTDDIRKIEETIGKEIKGAHDVVSAAMKGVGIEDGKAKFSFEIDPAFVETLETRAQEAGRTPGELMQDLVDFSFEQNWIYDVNPPDGKRRTFMPGPERFFSRLTGKENFTVEDVENAVRRLQKESKEVAAA